MEQGAGIDGRRSPRLHPQIHAREDGAGVTPRRRHRGTSPAAVACLPDGDDILREILTRLPPQPSSLPRASAVCKRWRGLVTDPKFLRSFSDHHRKPPLLGFFQDSNQGIVFTPVLDPPDRVHSQRFSLGRYSGSRSCALLDCRHGRVLFHDFARKELVVYDLITGQQRRMAIPQEFSTGFLHSSVLCGARNQGHVHGGCHLSPFKLVVVSMYGQDNHPIASVYSSEIGTWCNVISTEARYHHDALARKRATLVGNALYWLSMFDDVLEFDFDEHNLSMIRGPSITYEFKGGNRQIIKADAGGVGFALLSSSRFKIWDMIVDGDGVAIWVPWKTIELRSISGLPPWIEEEMAGKKFIRGYDEDTDVIFLYVNGSVYMVQLKSMISKKLYEGCCSNQFYPFKSFYTPGTAITGRCSGAEVLHHT